MDRCRERTPGTRVPSRRARAHPRGPRAVGDGAVAVRGQRAARAAALPRAHRAARRARTLRHHRVRPVPRRRPSRRGRGPRRRERDAKVTRWIRARRRRRRIPRVGRRDVPGEPVLHRVVHRALVRGVPGDVHRRRAGGSGEREAARRGSGCRGACVPRRSDVRGAHVAVAGDRDGAQWRVRRVWGWREEGAGAGGGGEEF